jgi:hypothetical protein
MLGGRPAVTGGQVCIHATLASLREKNGVIKRNHLSLEFDVLDMDVGVVVEDYAGINTTNV